MKKEKNKEKVKPEFFDPKTDYCWLTGSRNAKAKPSNNSGIQPVKLIRR